MTDVPLLARTAAVLLCAALLGPSQSARAQFTQYGPKLIGIDTVLKPSVGWSVALSGDGTTALLGGPGDSNAVGAAFPFFRGSSWFQQGPKLIGSGKVGAAQEGYSVSLSADGNTAIVGGWNDGLTGAAWVFTRSGSTWSQQGAKLIGTGAVGPAEQGWSVAVSADGNTVIIGGPSDNPDLNNGGAAGAAWIFVRSGAAWTQQAKLTGSGAVGQAGLGTAVALSGDGNTAIVGGTADNSAVGAAWVFTQNGGTWTQQAKLVANDNVGPPAVGAAVALSADGNTAIVGGWSDNNVAGAAWVFVRSGGTWTQQGPKLVGNGASGNAAQGWSVALSADGSTAIVGGRNDNNHAGAAWTFTRSGGTWTQLGNKLVGTNAAGAADQGYSVALSGDGNAALIGGPEDNNSLGAAWYFVQPKAKLLYSATHNFNGDDFSDIAWREAGGAAAAWLMVGAQINNAGGFGVVPTSWQIVGQRDFNNDGKDDWLWRDGATGTVGIWLLSGLSILSAGTLGAVMPDWLVAGTGDFNYDGNADILWYNASTGAVALWLMNGLSVSQTATLGVVPGNWKLVANDRKGNIFWRDANTGTLVVWEMYGFEILQIVNLAVVPLNWSIAGISDFDNNGSTDIVWRDTQSGTVAIWLMDGYAVLRTGMLGAVPNNWVIAATGNFFGFAGGDILWRDTSTGTVAVWTINAVPRVVSMATVATVGTNWTIQGLNAD